jgi:hypothetical protein
MPRFLKFNVTLPLIFTLASVTGQCRAQLDVASSSRLQLLQQSAQSAGDLVYQADVFRLNLPDAQPLYRYERRVMDAGGGAASTHMTRDLAGELVVVESAQVTPAYAMKRFDAINKQLGYSGSVVLSNDGRHVQYQLNDNGKISTQSESVDAPAVCGPSLFGFILQNWVPLSAGKNLPVRMIVLRAKTSYGFDIKVVEQTLEKTTFSIVPSSFFVRAAVAPMRVTFETATKKVIRYEGRVPPMQWVEGKLKDLDARVIYQNTALTYR